VDRSSSLSIDQLAALIEVARYGTLRAAAKSLFITEQGVRNRLIALEEVLGHEVYHKGRGVRVGEVLTRDGKKLLPEAQRIVDQARGLKDLLDGHAAVREIHIASSQYLSTYLLIDAIGRFHRAEPTIRIWLSVRTERDIERALLTNPELAFGVAAPYEPVPELSYLHLFSMPWSAIVPHRHPLVRRKLLRLADLLDHPLILFERGSTGRQHVMEAFTRLELSPRVMMEATTTDLIVRMVSAGMGVALVPLLPSGVVTRGHAVTVLPLAEEIRPIDSGILLRRGEQLSEPSRRFAEFVRQQVGPIEVDCHTNPKRKRGRNAI
jgi:DNA-binding transcriptional LysR family regulator